MVLGCLSRQRGRANAIARTDTRFCISKRIRWREEKVMSEIRSIKLHKVTKLKFFLPHFWSSKIKKKCFQDIRIFFAASNRLPLCSIWVSNRTQIHTKNVGLLKKVFHFFFWCVTFCNVKKEWEWVGFSDRTNNKHNIK